MDTSIKQKNLKDFAYLSNPDLFKKMEDHFNNDVLRFNDVKEAQWLISNIKPALQNNEFVATLDPFLLDRYKELIMRASWLVLSNLSEQEIIDLFRNHFALVLDMSDNLDVWEQLRAVLIIRYLHDERDEFKVKIRRALEQNQEVITEAKITIREQEVAPTIANWLRDYISHTGLQSVESIKQIEYLSASVNGKKISSKEKDKLRFLLHLYERLKHSTFSVEGLEEPLSTNIEGKEVTVKDGEVQQIDPRVERLLEKFRKVGLITEKDREPIGGALEESEEETVEGKENLDIKIGKTLSSESKVTETNESQLRPVVSQEKNILKPKPEEIKKIVPEKEIATEKIIETPQLQPLSRVSLNKEIVQEIKPKEEISNKIVPEAPIPKPVEPKQVERLKIETPQPPSFKNLVVNQKLAMSDVRSPSSVVGPVDELRLMNLSELRRTDTNLNRAIDKVYDKIIFLEEESFERMAEAVNAWRQSPLYRNYLDIVISSLASGKPIESVIEDERKSNPLSITLAEFKAIVALNKRLRV